MIVGGARGLYGQFADRLRGRPGRPPGPGFRSRVLCRMGADRGRRTASASDQAALDAGALRGRASGVPPSTTIPGAIAFAISRRSWTPSLARATPRRRPAMRRARSFPASGCGSAGRGQAFRPRLPRRPRFVDRPEEATRIALAEDRHAWFWASKTGLDASQRLPVGRVGFVEDGFLRSVGLGAALNEPASLVFDSRGIYFDPARASDLEVLIAAAADGQGDRGRAARLRARIVEAGVTKYNVGVQMPTSRPPDRRIVLVPGQVEDDASILRGCGDVRTNIALLERARAANADAWVIYKPHPDVEAGLRPGKVDGAVAGALADEIATGASADALLVVADEVWTLTSLMGFEALMRGKAVTCLGAPFYAGWGLTIDLGPAMSRRIARPTLDGPRLGGSDRLSGLPRSGDRAGLRSRTGCRAFRLRGPHEAGDAAFAPAGGVCRVRAALALRSVPHPAAEDIVADALDVHQPQRGARPAGVPARSRAPRVRRRPRSPSPPRTAPVRRPGRRQGATRPGARRPRTSAG